MMGIVWVILTSLTVHNITMNPAISTTHHIMCQADMTSLYALLLVTNGLILSTVTTASKLQG